MIIQDLRPPTTSPVCRSLLVLRPSQLIVSRCHKSERAAHCIAAALNGWVRPALPRTDLRPTYHIGDVGANSEVVQTSTPYNAFYRIKPTTQADQKFRFGNDKHHGDAFVGARRVRCSGECVLRRPANLLTNSEDADACLESANTLRINFEQSVSASETASRRNTIM